MHPHLPPQTTSSTI